MNRQKIFILFSGLICSINLFAQNCTTLGQTPATAFPVCGTSVFKQQTVPACGGRSIPVPGCNDGAAYGDLNPFWYKFTCFATGTLGFTITPITGSDDYDWQLFDITGKDPNDVFTNSSLYVTSNWSANPGATGTTTNATAVTNCAGFSYPNKSKMPVLTEGHQYLLLVSHFTDTNQSGYTLSFGGGTANITDPKDPHLDNARAYCDGSSIIVRLNKKMRCNTLASDGSDFSVSTGLATITGASAANCVRGFDMDSLTVNLSNPLPPGNYSLRIKKGADDNTILDNCDRGIPDGETISFTVEPLHPTPMDSIAAIRCAPDVLELVFKKPVRCNSIAGDGSDFIITGSAPVSIINAYGSCETGGVSSSIYVKLSAPIVTKGNFIITLRTGSDGNAIIDECEQETPSGASIPFQTADTVSAAFSYHVSLGCGLDTISYAHPGGNDINSWQWLFEDNTTSVFQHPQKIYSVFGEKNAMLVVSNGVCYDTASAGIDLDNELKAAFEAPEFICPEDSTLYKDISIGRIVQWSWTFGNGSGSTAQVPPTQRYVQPMIDQKYMVQLEVTDDIGCRDVFQKEVTVVSSCYVAVPTAFTPNNDGLNDYLYPLNAYKADNLLFRVYNVYGQKVFESGYRLHKWDGTIDGNPQRAGTYVWTLEYIHRDMGRTFKLKGTTTLIR
ncbi:MAG: gliding motility-associated C-terminal domain-containing protein [Chitinophagaceae bacterium]|nr:gliding motility-associated C-terminal domain-containing protein [Chitinophagaceae bacterium]